MGYILIIGAKSDIAKAVAKKYAENGYNLYLAARKSSELQNFANDIKIIENAKEGISNSQKLRELVWCYAQKYYKYEQYIDLKIQNKVNSY